jgi:hypothetical protein
MPSSGKSLLFCLLLLTLCSASSIYCACERSEGELRLSNCPSGAKACMAAGGQCYVKRDGNTTSSGCFSREEASTRCGSEQTYCCGDNLCNQWNPSLSCRCSGKKCGDWMCTTDPGYGACFVETRISSRTRSIDLERGCTTVLDCRNISTAFTARTCCRGPFCNGGHITILTIDGRFSTNISNVTAKANYPQADQLMNETNTTGTNTSSTPHGSSFSIYGPSCFISVIGLMFLYVFASFFW